jgi:hypothetical protein
LPKEYISNPPVFYGSHEPVSVEELEVMVFGSAITFLIFIKLLR